MKDAIERGDVDTVAETLVRSLNEIIDDSDDDSDAYNEEDEDAPWILLI